MFITVTTIKAPSEALDRMAQAFRHGAPQLKQFPGFLGFELWRSAETLEAVARWESRQAMEAYAKSDLFHAHHGGPGAQGTGAGQIEYYEGEVIV